MIKLNIIICFILLIFSSIEDIKSGYVHNIFAIIMFFSGILISLIYGNIIKLSLYIIIFFIMSLILFKIGWHSADSIMIVGLSPHIYQYPILFLLVLGILVVPYGFFYHRFFEEDIKGIPLILISYIVSTIIYLI